MRVSSEPITSLEIGILPPKSKAAQLLELLPAIEAALRAGHSHASIHNYLVNSRGLDLSFGYYELTLGRLRKRVRASYLQSNTISPVVRENHHSDPVKRVPVNTAPVIEGATSKIQDVLFGSASDFFS